MLCVMTDEQRQLRDDSDDLMEALDDMKRMEVEKRDKEISTAEFHELADAIEDRSRDVFRIAADERRIGDASPTTGDSIEDVRKTRESTAAD